jgi:hypothetical protein
MYRTSSTKLNIITKPGVRLSFLDKMKMIMTARIVRLPTVTPYGKILWENH